MVSALLMLHRLLGAMRYAVREEGFLPVLSAAALLVMLGTLAYALGEGWNVIDAFYFAIATLTTSNVADRDLELTHAWTKLFTVVYLLLGIGVLVELLRRVALAFIAVRSSGRDEEG